MATSFALGHKIVWGNNKWIYLDTGEPIEDSDRPCANCGRKAINVKVKIPEDSAYSENSYWKTEKIDACIAPIIKALQDRGIDMCYSCCGHGKADGRIGLQDGRALIIKDINGEKEEK